MCAQRGRGACNGTSHAAACAVLQWERIKKAGMAPGARTSFGMVMHKKRAILFGGVMDREGQVSALLRLCLQHHAILWLAVPGR